MLADVKGSGNEGFCATVLIKAYFESQKSRELDGREFMRGLNDIFRKAYLKPIGINALFTRIRVAERRLEVYPAGYSTEWYLGLGEATARMVLFAGAPLGISAEAGKTVYEIPFACRDQLMVFSDGAEPDKAVRNSIMDHSSGAGEELVDGIWKGILSDERDRKSRDLFLLGIELP